APRRWLRGPASPGKAQRWSAGQAAAVAGAAPDWWRHLRLQTSDPPCPHRRHADAWPAARTCESAARPGHAHGDTVGAAQRYPATTSGRAAGGRVTTLEGCNDDSAPAGDVLDGDCLRLR